MLVGDLMDRDLTSLGEDATLMEAIEVLSRHRIPGLPIVDTEGRVVGFLSEKDIVRAALPGYIDYWKILLCSRHGTIQGKNEKSQYGFG